jgi:hypothetical protein
MYVYPNDDYGEKQEVLVEEVDDDGDNDDQNELNKSFSEKE